MSYRIEGKDLVIEGWEQGIGEDPFNGIGDLRQVNIHNVNKTVAVGFPITETSSYSGATLGKPVARTTQFVSGVATNYYIVDDNGRVWTSTPGALSTWTYLATSNTTTSGDQNIGLAFYKGYLHKIQNSTIYYYKSGAWATFGSGAFAGVPHFSLVGQDSVLYFCNGPQIGSIMEKPGSTYDPATPATYIFATTALAIPSYDTALSLAEQGTNLLVGGYQNAIYPWNRISTSFTYPIFCAEPVITRMVTVNSSVFIFPGGIAGRGRIYITNGSQCEEFFKIPDNITGSYLGYVEPYYQFGDAIWWRNNLLFGMFVLTNDVGTVLPIAEVWALDVTSKQFRSVSTVPTAANGGSATCLIPNMSGSHVKGMGYIIGWNDATTGGIGSSSTSAGAGQAIVKGDLIPVGKILEKKTFEQVEIKLATPLLTGESLVVRVIEDLSTITQVGIMTSADGFSAYFKVNFQNNQWLEPSFVMNGNSEQSGVRLREMRLR